MTSSFIPWIIYIKTDLNVNNLHAYIDNEIVLKFLITLVLRNHTFSILVKKLSLLFEKTAQAQPRKFVNSFFNKAG